MARLSRKAIVLLVASLPACVVRLSDRFEPIPNGGVSGPPADCSKVQPLGKGAPGTGEAKTKLVGRYDLTDPAKPVFDWSGNYVEARFSGTTVTVGIETKTPVIFVATIDDRKPIKFKAVPNQTGYVLTPQPLPAGEHVVRVHRNTEALSGGALAFTGFNFGADGKPLPPIERPRRIEYIGDSITCGYGNEGANATCPYDIPDPDVPGARVPITENQYLAFGSIAARALDADAVTICWSGKGVYQNYREKEGDPDKATTIPEYYKRTVGSDRNGKPWDFVEPEPSVVVIAIGQNDFGRDVNADSISDGIDLVKFKNTYTDFLKFVRSKRPNAHIFLAVPPMLSDKFPLDNARSDCRSILRSIAEDFARAGDPKVYSMELLEMGVAYGLGCDYHPNLTVHEKMAEQVIGAIRSKTCW
jgi:hypothetical protein